MDMEMHGSSDCAELSKGFLTDGADLPSVWRWTDTVWIYVAPRPSLYLLARRRPEGSPSAVAVVKFTQGESSVSKGSSG